MKSHSAYSELSQNNHLAIERLTALWAFNEAALGGICHALKLPFTGLLVGGFAILLLCLIAHYAKDRFTTIIRATVIVLIVKAALSPHASPTAYLAVGFQGMSAALLFALLPFDRLSALILGILALLESACQKLLVMHLLFGHGLWESIDALGVSAAKQLAILGEFSWTKGVVFLYIGIYAVGGVFWGIIGGNAAGWLQSRFPPAGWQDDLTASKLNIINSNESKKKRYKRKLTLVTGFMILLLLLFCLPEEKLASRLMLLLLRFWLIVGIWYLLLAPLLMKGIRLLLRNRTSVYEQELKQVFDFLPALRLITAKAYEDTAQFSRWKRVPEFLLRMVTYSLRFKD